MGENDFSVVIKPEFNESVSYFKASILQNKLQISH